MFYRTILLCLFLFAVPIKGHSADDSLATGTVKSDTKTNSPRTINDLQDEDFKSFYIGIAETPGGKKIITIEIKAVKRSGEDLAFKYVMNSKSNREAGEGKIDLNERIITFGENDTGKFSLSDDGKIILESIGQDSTNHWKVKEK